jgi:hypothetical protein
VHFGELGPWKGDTEVLVDDVIQGAWIEGADLDLVDAIRRERAPHLADQRAVLRDTVREQEAGVFGAKSPRRIAERSGRRRVEPLDVVDRHDERSGFGEPTERAEDRNADPVSVDRRTIVLLEDECPRERPSLGIGQGSKRFLQNGVEKIADSRERQSGLAFRRSRFEETQPLLDSLGYSGTPQGRLPDAGFALEHEKSSSVRDARDEAPYGRELGIAADDGTGHDAPIVRLI